MKVKWLGQDNNRPETELYGLSFPVHKDVDISALRTELQRKLVKHPRFDAVDDEAKNLKAAPTPVKQPNSGFPQVSEYADLYNRVIELENLLTASQPEKPKK